MARNGQLLWSVRDLSFIIGEQTIFDHAEFGIHAGERVGLIGRNGAGKSTLLQLIRGKLSVQGAQIDSARGLRIAALLQESELDETLTVRANIEKGFADLEDLKREFESLKPDSPRHDELEQRLLLMDAWNTESLLGILLNKLGLNGFAERKTGELSGGEKRRVGLCAVLAARPDLLLLDEPTNHLDVETVRIIERFLADYRGTCFFVTHDRYFLDRIATRIVELERGHFFSVDGSYSDFLEAKNVKETAEDIADSKRRSFLRREVEWARRSPKARLKRNLGRLKRFQKLSAVRDVVRTGDIDLVIPAPEHLGNRVVDFQNITLARSGRTLLKNFNFEFTLGSHVGLIGPNGAGKSSLIQLMLGTLSPEAGTVRIAETVQFNCIDQNRTALDLDKTVQDEISGGIETIDLGTEKISVWSYLRRFLFEDDRIRTQVRRLSGGEKARLLLAKQLKHGGNFLVLDEPTNDLDLSSLRMLEEALANFPGCVLLVSHDRCFLDRVCDRVLVLTGDGRSFDSTGDTGYALEKMEELLAPAKESPAPKQKPAATAAPAPARAQKPSFNEKRELEHIEDDITAAETRAAEIEAMFSSPDFYAKHGSESAALQQELADKKAEAERLYARWEYLLTFLSGGKRK